MRPLTPRQLEVLRLATVGNRRAAVLLGITLRQVKRHWDNIYKNLDIAYDRRCKSAAVIVALLQGIVSYDDFGDCEMQVGDKAIELYVL